MAVEKKARKKPAPSTSRIVAIVVSVRFPNGIDVIATMNQQDGTAQVAPQTATRLGPEDALAWATYYEAVSLALDDLAAPPAVP